MAGEKPAPMRAQNVKNTIEKFPPSNKIFFLRPRRRRRGRGHHRRQSSAEELVIKQKEQWCASGGGGGSEKHLNVIRVVAAVDSRCCLASFHLNHQNKTTEEQKDEHREFAALPSLPWSLSPIFGINPNKSVATFVEGFNRGSVGSAREPLWMEV